MICLFYFATSVTANINVPVFTAQLVWPLCTHILVTSKSLPHTDWFSKHHRNMVNAVVIPLKCFLFPRLLLFFFAHRGPAFLLCQALPELCLCCTTVPFRLRQGLKVSKLLGNESSERSEIFLFSLILVGGCWKITNTLWKCGAVSCSFPSTPWHSCLWVNYLQVWQSITNLWAI